MTSHILIVEDEVDLRNVIAYTLQRAGYRVTQAEHGEAALALLAHTPLSTDEPYDVIITDLVMGNIDGIQVMRAALSQRDRAEVILLTGYGSLDSAMEAVRLGAFDYLLKPCRMPQLLERVEQAAEQRQYRLRREGEAQAWRKMRATFYALDDQESVAEPEPPAEPGPPAEPSYQQHVLHIGNLQIDTLKHTVAFREKPVHVTPTEYALLAALAAVAGQPVDFNTLIDQMHEQEHNASGSRSLLAWHIGNLRKKIDRHYIVSVRGVGYMLVDPYHADMRRY